MHSFESCRPPVSMAGCFALLLTLLALSANAADDGVADTHALALINAINAGSGFEEAAKTHCDVAMQERVGIEKLSGILQMLSGDLAPARIVSVQTLEDERREFVIKSSGARWVHMVFDIGNAPEFLVSGFSAEFVDAPLDTQSLPDTIGGAIDALVAEQVANNLFSGAVLVARNDQTVYSRAYGMADIAEGRRNTLATPINLGSMNKMFTALAIAQLVERGKIDYGDTVGKHLPDYPDRKVADKVTIHQLLTHTSGLGHYWNQKYDKRKSTLRTTSDFADLFSGDALLFEPGERMEYSNNGPVVLGLVIEQVSGLDYYEYIRRYIYGPAGMWHSGHYLLTDDEAGFATGYVLENDLWVSNDSTMGLRGSAGGGGYSSASDMLKFSQALMGRKLLGDEQLAILLEGKIDMGPGVRYAYGFGDHDFDGKFRYVGHNGGAPGISADFSIYPLLGYTVVVLANYDHGAHGIAQRIRQFINAYEEL